MQHDRQLLVEVFARAHRQKIIGGNLEDQLAHCAGWSRVLAKLDLLHGKAMDMGTGGGLPGLALAYWQTGQPWVLVDRREGRIQEVQRSIKRAGLGQRVEAIAAGVEVLGHDVEHRETYDLVVARSFGPPTATAEGAAGFLKVGGSLVVSSPPSGDAVGLLWPETHLRGLSLSNPVELFDEESGAGFLHLVKEAPLAEHLPRTSARFGDELS